MSIPERVLWALAAMLVLALAFTAWPAKAHSWFPNTCCEQRDCFEVEPGVDVEIVPGGYRIVATGEVIPMERTRETPPEGRGHWARCTLFGDPSKPTLGNHERGYGGVKKACLYVPPPRM